MKLFVYIQANAKKSVFDGSIELDSIKYGIPGEEKVLALKVKLAARPVDGAANQKLIDLIAIEYNVPRSSITITKGLKSRYKAIEF